MVSQRKDAPRKGGSYSSGGKGRDRKEGGNGIRKAWRQE